MVPLDEVPFDPRVSKSLANLLDRVKDEFFEVDLSADCDENIEISKVATIVIRDNDLIKVNLQVE